MRSLRIALILTAVCALALGATACATSDKDQFKTDYTPLNTEIKQTGKRVATAVNSASTKTDQEISREFADLSQQTNRLVRKLQQLKPYDEIEANYKKLINGLSDSASDLRGIAEAGAASDPDGARTASTKLVTDAVTVHDARRAVAKDVGLTG